MGAAGRLVPAGLPSSSLAQGDGDAGHRAARGRTRGAIGRRASGGRAASACLGDAGAARARDGARAHFACEHLPAPARRGNDGEYGRSCREALHEGAEIARELVHARPEGAPARQETPEPGRAGNGGDQRAHGLGQTDRGMRLALR